MGAVTALSVVLNSEYILLEVFRRSSTKDHTQLYFSRESIGLVLHVWFIYLFVYLPAFTYFANMMCCFNVP